MADGSSLSKYSVITSDVSIIGLDIIELSLAMPYFHSQGGVHFHSLDGVHFHSLGGVHFHSLGGVHFHSLGGAKVNALYLSVRAKIRIKIRNNLAHLIFKITFSL